jgi:hypothetical protein
MIFSLTNVEYELTKLLSATEKYDLVVIPPEYNHNIKLLQKFPPQKAVIYINDDCFPFCPDRRAHYALISRDILTGIGDDNYPIFCHRKQKPQSMALSFVEMQDLAAVTGITNVKYNLFNRLTIEQPDAAIEQLARDFVMEKKHEMFQEFMRSQT